VVTPDVTDEGEGAGGGLGMRPDGGRSLRRIGVGADGGVGEDVPCRIVGESAVSA
jgi:hypothetical protein